ncbi:HNH endonuclease signature motif containing protein [Bacillus haynesii]|uniref:HNH endonuclease signature motif containing protein n=1 Tax=Bacillus haynesii TaxID=1925021 RepID=UPI00227F9FFF|nr:HNH endonuclease signature motif containing protein [Bacillus haynesii]MCY8380123.1 HNH endonuclease [Bacillus haynesii]MCY8399157.1 HNH endonuclease [Bacillus haynesii]MCY8649546.1 HNH endonuclease [Bacillus haynesii]MCY9414614.1 HNH endonuclease [Bacillus haynesii]MEC0672992.1 HNH endonuclease signature motif containing protein [Bacillus haynesii]
MNKPLKPCNEPGCPTLTREGYCEQHKRTKPTYDQYRESAARRGYDSKWRKARQSYLSKHPFCVSCMKEGRRVPATVVDHITPHKGDKKLFWDSSNWQPLCAPCHNRKTAKEDGGFGNRTSTLRM